MLTIGDRSLACTSNSCQACVCSSKIVFSHQCITPKMYTSTYFLMLLSLFWVSTVLTNIVHCTTAGAIASWFMVTDKEMMEMEEISKIENGGKTGLFYHLFGGVFLKHNENGNNEQTGRIWDSFCDHSFFNYLKFSSIVQSSGVVFVSRALKRSFTSSFGSICLGSLIVSTLRVLRCFLYFVIERFKAIDKATGKQKNIYCVFYFVFF